MANELNTIRLIIHSTNYWQGNLQFRRHQIAKIAAQRNYEVHFVNPVFSVLSFITDKECRKIYFDFFRGETKNSFNVSIFTLPPLLPFARKIYFVRVLNALLSGILGNRYYRKLLPLERESVHIYYEPMDYYKSLFIKNGIHIYECVDDHAEYPPNFRNKRSIKMIEEKLIGLCTFVTATSVYLLERISKIKKEVTYIPNGVESKRFSTTNTVERSKDAVHEPVTLIYVGAIMEWFDFEIVKYVAERRPEWVINLVGPQTVRTDYFHKNKNVHCFGSIPQQEIPDHLFSADVGIIPFTINDLTRSVNPLKMYEYLSAGLPVVSTELPEVETLRDNEVIFTAKDGKEFIERIDGIVAGEIDHEKARNIGARYSWDSILAPLFDEIEKKVHEKNIIDNR
jgi:teichuronic acid biosynthesis glycosyltransferase TuaH